MYFLGRWLTLAARLLRLYISTESPSEELQQLVRFVVAHYAPVWFTVRQNSSCTDGAKNLHRSVELLRQLPETVQAIVRPVLQRNAFSAHPEQLLLSMVADDAPETRQKAVRLISEARQRQRREVRSFQLPLLNFEAQHHTDLIDWNSSDVTEPPLLRELSELQLQAIETGPAAPPEYPVHTQAVERIVKVVTQACSSVRGEESRDGLIAATLRHRRLLPTFNSKKDQRSVYQ